MRHVATGLGGILVFWVASASATMIEYDGMGYNKEVTYKFHGDKNSTSAGEIMLRLDGDPELTLGYCVDLDHLVKPEWTATIQPPSILGSTGNLVGFLYETFASTVDSSVKGAALQVAIWETRYDGNGNLNAGDFRLDKKSDASVLAQANTYLEAVPPSYTPNPSTVVLKSGDYPRSQDIIVPDPGTLFLLVCAGLPFMCRRSQRYG